MRHIGNRPANVCVQTSMRRWLAALALLLLTLGARALNGETVASLPAPSGYVNDFAGVLSPETKGRLERLCTEVDQQAHAQIAVVTVHTIDNDQPIEDFATELEEKWKVGPKGSDRGVLFILELQPHKDRIEVGYGLEGILNDAKAGDILRSVKPEAAAGDFNAAIPSVVQQLANIIATDAGVSLQPIAQQRHRPAGDNQASGIGGFLTIIIVAAIIISLMSRGGRGGRGGGGGLGWFVLGNLLGGGLGGRRGGGFGDSGGGWDGGGGSDGGGGFGGFGGGSSGGGGASGDF